MDNEHLKQFRELLIKADSTSIKFMHIAIEEEERKRYQVRMAQDFGSYGNETIGYRQANGTRTKEQSIKIFPPMPPSPLPHFDKSVFQ